MKQLSVIIPVYDIPTPMLEKCLSSVLSLSQSLKELEIIVINDASPNLENHDTLCALHDRRPDIIRLVEFSENKGVSHARNVGLDMCTGEYVAFVDADDIIMPDVYIKMLTKARKRKFDIVRCGCSIELNNQGDKLLTQPGKSFDIASYTPEIMVSVTKWCMGSACSRLFRRKFINNIRFTIGICFHEDSSFIWKLMCLHPKCCSIEDIGYRACFRKNSASRDIWTAQRYDRMINSAIVIFDEVAIFATEHPKLAKYLYAFILSESLVSRTIIAQLSKKDKSYMVSSHTLYRKYLALDTQFISRFQKFLLLCRMVWMKIYPSTYPLPLYYAAKYLLRKDLQ